MGPAAWDAGNSRKHLLDAIDASLRRLSTDYVDLYQLQAMDTILRSGRARYVGVSNILAYSLAKALGRQDTLKLTRFVSAQPRYNLLFREVEREHQSAIPRSCRICSNRSVVAIGDGKQY
jgi:aryl-alcohol dehydrogenase-like predicted oxidoreductase